MSCLRKGFKANNAREASRYPGVYTDVSVICLLSLMEMSLLGEFLRGYDTNHVSKTSVMKEQRIIG